MKRKIVMLMVGICISTNIIFSQTSPFSIYMEPINIAGLGGLQAYAYGQYDGKWLIMGGRLDGLHRRQPFASFDVAGNNNQLIVIDPVLQQHWTASITSLPTSIREQLSSTNMEFHQQGEYLYLIGGYGYHAATDTKKTFDNLTAVHVPSVINAVINNTSFTTYFRQITDSVFAVTGGHLLQINNTFYLVAGNKFDGNYNPMGGPSYSQVYTEAIRKFNLNDNGTTITINHLPAIVDATNLHRRDYNAVQQILPDGSQGITIFSGVFQTSVDLPFLNSVNIDSTQHYVNPGFQQYYNHYHCAVLPIYDAALNEMHNIFFGGIAQFYDSSGVLVQDNNVPFVNTIARVTRDGAGNMAEFKLPVEMPSLLGAGAEFISNNSVPMYNNEVFKLNDFTADTTLVGYIYGGISSTAKNIFFINTGIESIASSQIFKVFVIKSNPTSIDQLNTQSKGTLNMQIYPNPNNGEFTIKFNLDKPSDVTIRIHSTDGKVIEDRTFPNVETGESTYQKKVENLQHGGVYFVTLQTPDCIATRKVIIEE